MDFLYFVSATMPGSPKPITDMSCGDHPKRRWIKLVSFSLTVELTWLFETIEDTA